MSRTYQKNNIQYFNQATATHRSNEEFNKPKNDETSSIFKLRVYLEIYLAFNQTHEIPK